MYKHVIIGCSIVVLLTVHCQRENPVSPSFFATPEIILFNDWDAISLSDDPVTIEEAIVENDHLKLKITYAGGDENHDFELFGSEIFLESYPVQAVLYLSHNANGDTGKALITEALTFNLIPLKNLYYNIYQGKGPILLRIYEPDQKTYFIALIIYELFKS